jgi:predicted Zn-dependent peptidase
MSQERYRIPLHDSVTLSYQRVMVGQPLEARYFFPVGYADGPEGLWHTLFRILQQHLPAGWHSELVQTPDWTLLSLRALSDTRETFYQILAEWMQPRLDMQGWSQWLPLLQQEAALFHGQPENRFESAFFKLAWPETGYARPALVRPEALAALTPEQLQEAANGLSAQAGAYLQLRDSLPVAQVLRRLDGLMPSTQPVALAREPWPLPESEALHQTLEFPVAGGWVWQGFRVPGLLEDSWVHGLILQQWLEQVQLLVGLPESVDVLQCRWKPWMQGSLFYLVYHVSQAAELEKAKFQMLEWLLQAQAGYLTPRRLRKAIQSCHTAWWQAVQHEGSPALALVLDEAQHGSTYFKQRLQRVSLESLQAFWRQYLQADNLITLEILHESVRKQRHASYREHFPQLGYRQVVAVRHTRPPQKLQVPAKVELGQGAFARLYPVAQTSSLALGAWFAQGSRNEGLPGVTSLLLALLAQQFDRLLQQQSDASGARLASHTLRWHVDRDFSCFYWLAPLAEYRQALLLFRQLLEPLMPDRQSFERCRRQLLASGLHRQFSLLREASQRFYQSGFGKHAYARDPLGAYYALQALAPEDLQRSWEMLFLTDRFQPLFAGALPEDLGDLLPEVLARASLLELPAPEPERSLLLRRGEIQMQISTPLPLRLEGRIFPEPLPLAEMPALSLIQSWLKQLLGQRHPGLGTFQMEWLQQAWLFYLLLPDTHESWLWRNALPELDLSAFEAQRQSAIAQLRAHKSDLSALWPAMARWEALGAGAGALLDLDRELLVLQPEQVRAALQRWFGERHEWLQIKIHT